jgi:RimJ/RimL family protein N-acetyltransferase
MQQIAFLRIRTARLLLRPFEITDVFALHAAFERNRGHLDRWMEPAPEQLDHVLAFLRDARAQAERGTLVQHGIFLDDELIGSIQIAVTEHAAHLGYWLDREHVGRGYATEAATEIVRVALETGLTPSLEVRCHSDNHASVRLARRLGFRFVGRDGDVLRGTMSEGQASDAWPDAEATWTSLRATLEEAFGGQVPVAVSAVSAVGEPSVLFTARIGRENAIAPQDLLRHNATLAVGAICICDGHCVLRHVAPLASLSVPWAVRAVALIAHEAGRLSRELSRTVDPKVFTTFAE